MRDNNTQTPHFYLDKDSGKWISVERSTLPKVLVLSWHGDPGVMVEELLRHVDSLPAEVVPIAKDRIPDVIGGLRSPQIVACVLSVSPDAMADKTFFMSVDACQNIFLERREFRLRKAQGCVTSRPQICRGKAD